MGWRKILVLVATAVIVLLGGLALGVVVSNETEQDLPEHPTPLGQQARAFQNITTTVGGTTYVCTSPCEGETLATNGQQRNTPQAATLIGEAVAALKLTTISGKKYCLAMAGCRGTGYVYRGGAWFEGLGKLVLAQALSPATTLYDDAGQKLIATTVSGKTYFADPAKYAGGNWYYALRALSQEQSWLSANPQTSGPSIYVK